MFEAQRRYKEFFALRAVLVKRFPGLYVPPIPPKKTVVSLLYFKIFREIKKHIS